MTATLTMTSCNVYGNSASSFGGGIVAVRSLTLTDCNVGGTSAGQGNTAATGGGINTGGTFVGDAWLSVGKLGWRDLPIARLYGAQGCRHHKQYLSGRRWPCHWRPSNY